MICFPESNFVNEEIYYQIKKKNFNKSKCCSFKLAVTTIGSDVRTIRLDINGIHNQKFEFYYRNYKTSRHIHLFFTICPFFK